MSITNHLRSYISERVANGISIVCANALINIADRIDEAIASEYVRLPKDKDGEVIHFGDVLYQFGAPMEVVAMSDPDPDQGDCMLKLIDDRLDTTWVRARKMRHHDEPTVESLLRDFYVYAERGVEHHRTDVDMAVLIEYSDRIREMIEHEHHE